MTRQDFLKLAGIFGLGITAKGLTGCAGTNIFDEEWTTDFNGEVLVIGAGSAGMTAAFVLKNLGVNVKVIEAADTYGGRVKRNVGLADFPIDLGAEWIHTDPTILGEIADDASVNDKIETIVYKPQTYSIWKNEELKSRDIARFFYSEYKFKSTTWFGFFEEYIVPTIQDDMIFNEPIGAIDSTGDKVLVEAASGTVYEADKVIVTIPVLALQDGDVKFTPELSSEKTDIIKDINMPDGIKVFMTFQERFYPDFTSKDGILSASEGEFGYYDAAFGKDSSSNVLALFTVGDSATLYVGFDTEKELIDFILAELDEYFDGKASENFIEAVVQNWTTSPYIRGSYSQGLSSNDTETLRAPIEQKIYFAGEVFGGDNSSTVHGAAKTGYEAVKLMLGIEG